LPVIGRNAIWPAFKLLYRNNPVLAHTLTNFHGATLVGKARLSYGQINSQFLKSQDHSRLKKLARINRIFLVTHRGLSNNFIAPYLTKMRSLP
jgi:hypothetical protein